VGINKKREDWVLEGEGFVDGATKEPTQKLVVEWIVDVYNTISSEMGWNAWQKKGFEWF
jgi:hypothetical protein